MGSVEEGRTRAVAYFDALPPAQQAVIRAVRGMILEMIPDLVEGFRYGMPTYENDRGVLFALAARKQYYSLYVMDTGAVKRRLDELKGLDVGKSCIRFRKLEVLPRQGILALLQEARPIPVEGHPA